MNDNKAIDIAGPTSELPLHRRRINRVALLALAVVGLMCLLVWLTAGKNGVLADAVILDEVAVRKSLSDNTVKQVVVDATTAAELVEIVRGADIVDMRVTGGLARQVFNRLRGGFKMPSWAGVRTIEFPTESSRSFIVTVHDETGEMVVFRTKPGALGTVGKPAEIFDAIYVGDLGDDAEVIRSLVDRVTSEPLRP